MKNTFFIMLLVAVIVPLHSLHAQGPMVVATIRPVHALVSMVMEDVAEPVLLIDGVASPHDYTLRPQQARQLHRADIIVWAGPDVESFLPRIARSLPGKARMLAMREAGNHHHDYATDPHIWLSPTAVSAFLEQVEVALAEQDPAYAEAYHANRIRWQARIQTADIEWQQQLMPYRDQPYIVYHDAYHHFYRHFGLQSPRAVTRHAHGALSARQMQEVHAEIAARPGICFFSEPQTPQKTITAMTEGTSARTGTLDPLGSSHPPGKDLYLQLMENLVDGFVRCMKDPV